VEELKGRQAKVLLYDLETSPIISYNWGIWEQNAIEVIQDWQILCFSYLWLGDKKAKNIAQWDFKGHKSGGYNLNDYNVVSALRDLFDEADVTIAHNGNSFDAKKARARMMIHKLPPPTPSRQIDTKLEAKKIGGFTSNKLDFINKALGHGGKADAGGFETWKLCMEGDRKAQKKMVHYNNVDVETLQEVYLDLRVYMTGHPPMNVYAGRPDSCPKCGEESTMIKGAFYRATNTNLYQYYRCKHCGGMAKSRIPEPQIKKFKYVN